MMTQVFYEGQRLYRQLGQDLKAAADFLEMNPVWRQNKNRLSNKFRTWFISYQATLTMLLEGGRLVSPISISKTGITGKAFE